MQKCVVKDKVEFSDKSKIEFSGFGLYDNSIPKIKDNRYFLEIDLDSSKENTLIAFMINPSKTFPEISGQKSAIDGTIKNLIKIAYRKYAKLIVLNLFSVINPKQEELKRNPVNDNFIKKFFEKDIESYKNPNLLIACGHDKKKNYTRVIKEIITGYTKKFNKVLCLSVDIDKFKNFIETQGSGFVLHPTNRVIEAYGGYENIKLKEFGF